MKLPVPLIRQAKGSSDCGIACVAMILEYYGIKKSIEEIKKDVAIFKNVGTYMPQLGNYFLSQNFDVEIVTINPHLFNVSFKNASQKKLLTHLKKRYEVIHIKEMKKCVEFFIKFIEAGGKLTVGIPNTKDIKEEIKNKRPLLVQLTSSVLSTKHISFNSHFNIITGIDAQKIHTNDPAADSTGGRHDYVIDDYLYAIHAAAFGEADNASIMIIKCKN